ncbi:MAG: PKD domain-containing protein, partial [Candidatus Thermoplasmatota archaeon]
STSVLVSVDGRTPRWINATPGAQLQSTAGGLAWSWPFSTIGLITGEHSFRFVAVGPGDQSAPRDLRVLVHTARVLSILGEDAPHLTLTPLVFQLHGAGGDDVAWSLDGEPAGGSSSVTVQLATPGDHMLEASVSSGGVARLPLYALDRLAIVSLVATPAPASAPTLFDAQASDADGTILRYAWDFGDGESATTTQAHAEHAYARPGLYHANVSAIDDFGEASVPAEALVAVPNHAPIPDFAWAPHEPSLFDTVLFDDTSSDPDGRVVQSAWDFGEVGGAAAGPRARHQFATRGDHAVALIVQDDSGAVSTLAQVVHVRNLPPTVAFQVEPATPQTGETIQFIDASLKTDGRIVQWVWDFGDGVTGIEQNVSHAYQRPGRYPVTLTVKDDWGDRTAKHIGLLVADAHPDVRGITADPPAPRSLDAVRFQTIAFDREGPITSILWDFGDNSTSNATAPVHRYAHSGAYNVTVTASDSAGLTGSLNMTIFVSDSPPTVAFGGIDGGHAGLPTTVRANASDVDGRIVSYVFDMDGDGTPDCMVAVPACTFTFPHDGVFQVWISVTDDEGATATAFHLIDIVLPPSGLAPPSLRVDAPAAGTVMRGDFLVRGTAEGVTPVRLVEMQMRNGSWAFSSSSGAWASAIGTSTWTLLLDTRAFPDGDLQFVVRATDESGSMTQVQVPVTVDNERSDAPAIDLRVTSLQPHTTLSNDTSVRGVAYSSEGVTSVRWRVDEGAWRPAHGNGLSWAIPLTLRGLAPGEHDLAVEAWHGVSDHESTLVPFRVAGEAPVLLIDVPPGPIAYGVLHAEGRATPGARVLWRIDDQVWREASGSASWRVNVPSTAWEDGAHTVTMKAVNDELDIQSTPIVFPIRVMNVDPHDTSSVQTHVTQPKETPLPAALLLVAIVLTAFGAPRRRL